METGVRERRHERSDDALRTRCERLLEAHRGIAFKVAATYCRHVEDRRDLVQEIHAQVWRAFPAYDDARPFSTWMYRIALNVAISATRAAQSALPLDRLDAEPADDVDGRRETDDGVRALYRCIARLAPLDRALLLLYLDEKSHREIADVLGLSETNVATKIGRLKRRIRDDLDPTGE